MIKRSSWVVYLLAWLLTGSVSTVISFATEINTVLIISIDALHPDAIGPKSSPNLQYLMEHGSYTFDGSSTNPPLTLVSHTAMFTGKGPEKGGRTNNTWQKRQPGIKGNTIFNDAGTRGFSTGFFYSKEKLGYLVNPAVDQHTLDPDFSVENALDFFKASRGKQFCFLHISGLDRTGPLEGWLSPGYMEELFFIDKSIAPLISMVRSKGRYLMIVTSDHAGHGKVHGSDHPEDARLPLIMASDLIDLAKYQGIHFPVTHLKSILESVLPPQNKGNAIE